MTGAEWAYFEPFLVRGRGRRPRDHRKVLDGIFWLMRTGAPWRDLPQEFGVGGDPCIVTFEAAYGRDPNS